MLLAEHFIKADKVVLYLDRYKKEPFFKKEGFFFMSSIISYY